MITGIVLDNPSVTLEVGHSLFLEYRLEPDDDPDIQVVWESSASDVVSIDQDGRISAVAPGTAAVTVSVVNYGFSAQCQVTVTAPPEPDFELAGTVFYWDTECNDYLRCVVTNDTLKSYDRDGSLVLDALIEEYDNQSRSFIFSFAVGTATSYIRQEWQEPVGHVMGTIQYKADTLEGARTIAEILREPPVYMDTGAIPPVIMDRAPDLLVLTVGEVLDDPGVTVRDYGIDDAIIYAGNVTSVDVNTAGNYSLIYDYTDGDGNDALPVTRTVEVGSGLTITVQ